MSVGREEARRQVLAVDGEERGRTEPGQHAAVCDPFRDRLTVARSS